MQVLPTIALRPYIRHYLLIENTGAIPIRFFSDGNTGIVFSFGSLFLDGQVLPSAFAYGQISAFKDLQCTPRTTLLIAVLRPYGMHALLGIPATEMKDQIIDLATLLGKRAPIVNDLPALETFFLQLTSRHENPLMQETVQFIEQKRGQVSMEQLEHFTGYHERQLERRFQETIGLTPVKFSNIIRLHAFIKDLHKGEKITSVAYEHGYYDQAHAIRDFKRLTGLTPRHYLHKSQPLASNFVGIIQF